MATAAEIARAEIAEWLTQAPGLKMNPDKSFGLQCVDAADQFAQDILDVPWRETLGAVVGARDLMDTANETYWIKVWNNPDDPAQVPPTGALVIWDGTGGRTPNPNPYGHVAVTLSATAPGGKFVQQDGFAAPLQWVTTDPATGAGAYFSDKPCHIADLGWDNPGTGPVRGWLIARPEKVKDTGALARLGPDATPVIPQMNPTATVTPSGIMHGIDVSSHQKGIDLAKVSADFVIVKVSGGTAYLNPEARAQVTAAKKSGKQVGLYHYAHEAGFGPSSAKAEAEFFVDNAAPLMDENTVLVLDWEAPTIIGPGGNVWARDFLNTVASQTGTTPWLYSYLNALEAHQWPTVAKKYPLWLAWYGSDTEMRGYATDFTLPFKVPAGFKLAAWQYSQFGRLPGHPGSLDLNVFFGNGDTWRGFAQGKSPAVKPPAKIKPVVASNTNVAPKPRVHVVQPGEFLSAIALRYGTTVAELQRLNRYIVDPSYLNVGDRITLPPVPAVTQCIVEAGDSLSLIAAQFGTTVANLRAKNPAVRHTDVIHPGQVLNL